MEQIHDIGFSLVSQDNGCDQECRINIIFVHGLKGHPERTWGRAPEEESKAASSPKARSSIKSLFRSGESRSKSGSKSTTPNAEPRKPFWPYEFLQPDTPEARLWTYGYNAHVIEDIFKPNNKNSISQHGRDLAAAFEREIGDDPVIFVAHSLGGIIVKDAIRRSESCRLRTKLIIFLGTPHRGSMYADWGRIATNLACLALHDANKKLVETLEVNNEVLDNIHEQFITIVHESDIKIHSFQESRGLSGMKGFDGKVVDDFSSKLDLPRAIETVESIDADHKQMTKFADKGDPGYRAISGVIKKYIRSISQDDPPRLPNRSSRLSPEAGEQVRTTAIQSAVTKGQKFFHVPFPANERFTGRIEILKTLQRMLFLENRRSVALVGLGGIGKSQIALHLASWIIKNEPEYSVFWVPALSHATFEQAYGQIMRECGVQGADGEDPKDAVRQYLNSKRAGKWLLVLDNADDIGLLRGATGEDGGLFQFLPTSDEGRILFTTRSRKVAISVSMSDIVIVPEMDSEEAKSCLEKLLIRTEDLENPQVVDDLLKVLTHLPLAIKQAAAYLNENQITIAEYLDIFKNTDQDLIELLSAEFDDETRYRQSQNAIARTWFISFSQIRMIDEYAAKVLLFMACIEPRSIPQSLLPRSETQQRLTRAIGILCGYGFLNRRGDSGIFDMHNLVHLATQIWAEEQNIMEDTRTSATEHLASVFPSDKWENRELWRQYLPHAIKLLEAARCDEDERVCELGFWVSRCLHEDGRIKEAVYMLKHVVAIREKTLAEDHPDQLASQHELAAAYLADGQVKEAVYMLEHVVAIQEKTLAEDHPSRLASHHELAAAYQADGQVKEAVYMLEHVVAIEEKTLAEDHPSRLASHHELAAAYQADGQVKEAVYMLEHVVAIQEKTLAEDHPSRLTSQHELAAAYLADGQVKEAVYMLERIVAIEGKILREDHPDRLASHHELAAAYQADGQVKEAVYILERIVAIEGKILREDHPDRLASQYELARAYLANDQVKEALHLLERVVTIEEKNLAADHPSRLASQHELARAYKADSQTQESIHLLQ